MPYRLEKFKMEHLQNFDAREEQLGDLQFLKEHQKWQDTWMFELPIFTLSFDNVPLLIIGMQNTGSGTYFPMAFAAKSIDKHRFTVVRCIYEYVEKFVGDDVRRFEAYVAATDKKANRLAKFFGMEPVGIRRQAGTRGEDQIIYERLWRK